MGRGELTKLVETVIASACSQPAPYTQADSLAFLTVPTLPPATKHLPSRLDPTGLGEGRGGRCRRSQRAPSS